jgi:hypothetical protein
MREGVPDKRQSKGFTDEHPSVIDIQYGRAG